VFLEMHVADGLLEGVAAAQVDLGGTVLLVPLWNVLAVAFVALLGQLFDAGVETPLETCSEHGHGARDFPLRA